jgi:superfamily I DNA and/or RNA helicase
LMEDYQGRLQALHEQIARFLQASIRQRRQRALDGNRREFLKLAAALRARTNRKQEEWFAQINLDLLLRTFPVWMTPLTDAGSLLPFKPALFDLVIVDEATQCDMASCLPVFFRARRVVVTGDPRQLRHLSFLSRERQHQIAGKWGLREAEAEAWDYRAKSLLDRVNESILSQQQVVFLDEHFRSRPPIIAFSNREFYGEALKIMTRRPDTLAAPALELRGVNGRRDSAGPNRDEAEQVVAEVVRWVESEKNLPSNAAHTLGVLSPFREQVDYLFARLSKRLDLATIEKHRLRIGTAHSFQGEERDVMLLSLALDRYAHPGAFRYLDRPDVFNVSITRARNLQVVFCSLEVQDLPAESLLRRYLEAIARPVAPGGSHAPSDAFLKEVQGELTARGFQSWPCYVVAGMPVDLMVEKNGHSLGIDLIGHPGQFAAAFDLEKYRLFQRAGLRLFPLSLSAWRKERSRCLEAIDRWLDTGFSTANHHQSALKAKA